MQKNGTTFALITLGLLAVLAYLGISGWFSDRNRVEIVGGDLIIHAAHDGHFRIKGTINEVPVTFLIDTGATGIAVNQAVAKRAGLQTITKSIGKTANGDTDVALTKIDLLRVENIQMRDMPAMIMPNTDAEVLLGMSFLRYFNWSHQANELRLTPEQSMLRR